MTADTKLSRTNLGRIESVHRDNPRAISTEALDTARANSDSAQSTVAAAKADLEAARASLAATEAAGAAAEAQVTVAEADVRTAEAGVRAAELQVSYTKIRAPAAGKVTRKAVEPGDYVSVNQALLTIVPPEVWVTANFKETQLAHMRPGQPVEIAVDAFPDREFHGKVDSVQRGTGARFSLLPPENATGNFVKVVQRVPVKIIFNDDSGDLQMLGPGMSVEPKVDISSAR